MKVYKGIFECDECFIKIDDISAVILSKDIYECEAYDDVEYYFVVHLKNTKMTLPIYISKHFDNNVKRFIKYLGIK